jgi:hypothetical protein
VASYQGHTLGTSLTEPFGALRYTTGRDLLPGKNDFFDFFKAPQAAVPHIARLTREFMAVDAETGKTL